MSAVLLLLRTYKDDTQWEKESALKKREAVQILLNFYQKQFKFSFPAFFLPRQLRTGGYVTEKNVWAQSSFDQSNYVRFNFDECYFLFVVYFIQLLTAPHVYLAWSQS